MRARRLVFHLRAADEDRVEGLSMHTVCNRHLSWEAVVLDWAGIPYEYRCRQCEFPGRRNVRAMAPERSCEAEAVEVGAA